MNDDFAGACLTGEGIYDWDNVTKCNQSFSYITVGGIRVFFKSPTFCACENSLWKSKGWIRRMRYEHIVKH